VTIADALRRPEVTIEDVRDRFPEGTDVEIGARVEIELKMDGYVRRQQLAIERAAREEAVVLPGDLDYAAIRALSREGREKLDRVRPRTLGAAARIPGLSPADIALLSVHVRRRTAASA
jgi:tRNA uridine 5-carboxymethylaminomethyl modification enzyme